MKPFHFREFTVHQNHAVLKVGTDAMILGALAKAESPYLILDIGTGTGVLALMMAQKFADAQITAIDLDAEALIDCQRNFEESPWSERMHCFHQDVLLFPTDQKFDLIICNPPFYEQSSKSESQRMNAAKHTSEDFLVALFAKSKELLSPNGVFWIVLPSKNFKYWKDVAERLNLFIQDEIIIQSKAQIPKRCVGSFKHLENSIKATTNFVIRNLDNSYTKEYIKLTKNFHCKNL